MPSSTTGLQTGERSPHEEEDLALLDRIEPAAHADEPQLTALRPSMRDRVAGAWRAALAIVILFLVLHAAADLPAPAAVASAALCIGLVLLRREVKRPDRVETRIAPRAETLPRRTEKLLESMPDPAIVIDQRSLVLYGNDEARRLLPSLKVENPLSFSLRAPDVLDAVEVVLAGGPAQDVAFVERVPVERAFDVRVVPLEGVGPRHVSAPREAAILVFRDATPMRRLEHMRVDFIANASHELRTPLASLLGFIETLQGPARNDAAARERFLQIMAEQGQRMARLIDDLLSLSRIELNAHVKPATPVDVVGVVRQIVDALSAMAAERSVALAVVQQDAPRVMVEGDRDELLRVFENLIENAIKYGQSGGRVDVSITLAEKRPDVTVSIRDYGPGIAPEHLPRLTERFYRVDVAASRDKGGTGLGLAIVKHIVNRHRGRLAIESEEGEGATFQVTLALGPFQTH